jgi:cellulose synthase/poly-beta-1,6-N-acetylglucosamine synthase-like glycosyltransferase
MISIVIPTYNEEKTIARKLDNTIELNHPKDDLEIVITDSSDDGTVEIIEEYRRSKDIKIVLIHEDERRGLPHGLNVGYSAATGDIVVKTDCDAILDKNALKYAIESFRDEKIGCVTGRAVPIGSKEEEAYRDINMRIQMWESKIDSTIIAHGPFMAFRRELLVPIDEDSLADDSEISLKIRRQGYRSILNPDIIFYERTPKGREEQKIRRASGLIRLLWRNKNLLFNPKYGNYGLFVFPFNFFMMIVLPSILSPLLLILEVFNARGGAILETQSFLLKAMHRLMTKRTTVFWEPDKDIR